MHRPVGFTILSLLLAWLAVGGALNAWVWNLADVQDALARLPSNSFPNFGGSVFVAVFLAYAVSAAFASAFLWRMHRFAPRAYALWCAVVFASAMYMVFAGFEENVFLGLLFALATTGLALLPYPYIASRFR